MHYTVILFHSFQSDIARKENLIQVLINVSKKHTSPSHPRAMAILAHLTRSPRNSHYLVFHYLQLLPMLQNSIDSPDPQGRKYALCAIQNLCMDKSCRAPIAHTAGMIRSLTGRCKGGSREECHAAIAALQNLSDEPANLIQFTIVKNCIATILSMAQSDNVRMSRGIETDLTQFMAKNTLATISYWFRKIATSGTLRRENDSKYGTVMKLCDAVLQPEGYCQWI